MSRKTRNIICSILVVVAFCAGIIAYAQTQEGKSRQANADGSQTYLIDRYGKIQFPTDPVEDDLREEAMKSRGNSETNPFLILEIVPYEGMAEFGYQIDGQEPIDVHAKAQNSGYIPGETDYYNVTYGVTFRYWVSDKPATLEGYTTDQMNQYGTMTYLPGSGHYNRTVDETDAEGNVTKATYTASAGGDFYWAPLSAEACYALTAGEKSLYETGYQNATSEGDSFKTYLKDVDYVYRTGNKLEHKNTFLRESVGLAYKMEDGVRILNPDADEVAQKIANFHSLVITVTPEDLNLNPELVDRADMIVISTEANMGQVIDTYETKDKYLRPGKFGYELESDATYGRLNNKKNATFKTNLLNWEIALRIYERATNPVRICPILTDAQLYSSTKATGADTLTKEVKLTKRFANAKTYTPGWGESGEWGTQNNMTKLFLMMYQMTNPVFESFYGEVTTANHPMFSETNMKNSSNQNIVRKGVTLKTGVFNYDMGWTDEHGNAQHAQHNDSKIYWNDLTLYPWQIMPYTGSGDNRHKNVGEYGKYAAMFGIMVEDSETYKNNITSGDAQNSIRNGLVQYDGGMTMSTDFADESCKVKNNEYGAEVYEFFDSINGAAGAPPESGAGCLTMADCLYYLLNGLQNVHEYNKEYKVLELQPTASFENKEAFWDPFIANLTDSLIAPTVDQMTTSEFIGSHVECISEYDLIYVGMNKNPDDMTMNFTSGTNFTYAHTGPKLTVVGSNFQALYGWLTIRKAANPETHEPAIWENLDWDREKKFVFSGNDLTELALTKLKEYDQAKHPILFSEGFYTDPATKAIATTVDGNSYMYALGKNVNNAFSVSDIISPSAQRTALRKVMTVDSKKVELIVYQSPRIYNRNNPEAEWYIDDDRTLRFKFKIDAPAGTSYTLKLYVDSNTDGIFTEGQEDVGALVYSVSPTGGQTSHSGALQAGQTYAVTRVVADRIGSVAWKLDLISGNKVYASLDGVSAIKIRPGEDAIPIKVLQIEPKDATDCLVLPTDAAEANTLGGGSQVFYQKVQEIIPMGFDISFERMDQDEILELIDPEKTTYVSADYLYDNYDMLVLGFADIYDGVSEDLLLDAIQKFIINGKAVLYTHDTSSTIGDIETSTMGIWGKQITLKYRDMFGMDRYGALGWVNNGAITPNKDIPYKPVAGSPQHSSIHKSDAGNRNLIQGVANGMLFRTLYPGNYGQSDQDSNVNTTKVSRVNTGAITQFPFTIDETITVATTHPQYYQLDMDRKDMIVWYCLALDDTDQEYEQKYFGATPNDVRNNYYIYNMGNITYSGMGHLPYFKSQYDMDVSVAEIELFVNTFVAAYRAAAKGVTVKVLNDDATSNPNGDQFLCVDVDSSKPDEIIGSDIVDTARTQLVDGDGYKPAPATDVINQKSKRVYFRLENNNTYGVAVTSYDLKMTWNGGVADSNGLHIDGTPATKMLAVYRLIDTNGDGVYDTERFVDNKEGGEKFAASLDHVYYVDVPIKVETPSGGVRAAKKTDLAVKVEMIYMIGEMPFPKDETTNVTIMPRGLFDLN